MEINNSINCPICSGSAKKIKHLSVAFIYNKLSEQLNSQIPNNLEIVDYDLMKCNVCSFEFAFPQAEGSGAFYDWVTLQPGYYVESRWEYSKVLELLTEKSESINLLDVGCGDGQFFDLIIKNKNSRIDFYGLDTTSRSVEICQGKSYKAFCMDIQEFKSVYSMQFDAITAFHVLEHIADPKKFLEELIAMTKPNGSIYISTPFSPMDFELEWYDALNHPPHHMGRWNLDSYKKIADVLGLKLEIFMPEYQGLIKSTLLSLKFSVSGAKRMKSKFAILKMMILHPFKLFTHLYKQSNRFSISGKRASNVILVKFTKMGKS